MVWSGAVCLPMHLLISRCILLPPLFTDSRTRIAVAMDTMSELALFELAGGGPRRSRDVSVTLEHNFFQVLCRRNKKPSKVTVKMWWALLKQPLDDTNVHSILNLVRRSLLDWPKMGAAIAEKAQQDLVLARKEKELRKRVAAKAAKMLVKQKAQEAVLRVSDCSASTNTVDQMCRNKKQFLQQ
mgnify:CR=1 FL=1